jgi:hypothetical protein
MLGGLIELRAGKGRTPAEACRRMGITQPPSRPSKVLMPTRNCLNHHDALMTAKPAEDASASRDAYRIGHGTEHPTGRNYRTRPLPSVLRLGCIIRARDRKSLRAPQSTHSSSGMSGQPVVPLMMSRRAAVTSRYPRQRGTPIESRPR